MPAYRHPGVYIEELPSGLIPIEAASTSIAAFIGFAYRGALNTPTLITKLDDFKTQFGKVVDAANGIRDLGDGVDAFGHAVSAFFLNGGRKAYIVRVAKDTATASGALANPADMGNTALYMTATSPGTWGDDLVARIEPVDAADLDLGYVLEVGTGTGDDFEAVETFSGVSMNPDDGQFVGSLVNDGSALIDLELKAIDAAAGGGGTTKALKSKVLLGVDLGPLNGKSLEVGLSGAANPIPVVNFTAAEDTIEKVAAKIQSTIRGTNSEPRKSFRALPTNDGRIIMISGSRAAGSEVTIAGGDAAPILEFATVVDYPAQGEAEFFGGDDGNAGTALADYSDAFTALRDYRDASILLFPGLHYETTKGKEVIDGAIAHAEFMKNRVVVVDPKPSTELKTQKDVKDQALPHGTSYTALYYPWLQVANPFYNPDTAANKPKTLTVAPSAFAAGIWARIDSRRGVWKAPAGLEATVRGVQGPQYLVGNDIQDQLNGWGINCIRPVIGPQVVWGARMLATKTQPDFRYVPVRRTSILIGESLYNALQAVVFEPNKHTLWAALRASVGGFMDGLFRAGAFQGEKAADAYFVRCGLGDTMTQGDIDAGIVRVVVGYAPLKPAEFVVVQIQQKLQSA